MLNLAQSMQYLFLKLLNIEMKITRAINNNKEFLEFTLAEFIRYKLFGDGFS